jgi:ribosomal protein S18 acetylase RimI-like enzyme
VLRDFDVNDQPVVRALILSGMADRWGDQFDAAANPDTDDLWSSYVLQGGEIVVVEERGVIVATGALVRDPDGAGRILRLSVDRRCRRRGLARKVVAELVERARRRDLATVRVTTDTPWSDAVALYSSCGFEVVVQTEAATHFSMSLRPPG